MHDTATLIITIIGAIIVYTTSVVAMVSWLNTKFRTLEQTMYKEFDKRREANDRKFGYVLTKIQRLNLKIFGFTENPSLPDIGEGRYADVEPEG